MKDKIKSLITKSGSGEKKNKNPKTGNGKGEVKIVNIGGTTTVTGNITVYETEKDIIIVDCGIGFPDSDMPGVDVVIPDFTYILENKEKVRALFITHAHEDHFGATPFLLKELDVPVYGGKLVLEFVKKRLEDKASKQIAESASLHEIEIDKEITVGDFKLTAFRLNHSVPGAMGFGIRTPQGLIVHVSDFKIDWTPVIDPPLDLGKIAKYGEEGVLCLMSDCLGVTHRGYSQSEKTLSGTFDALFEKAGARQILVTTISSNISRMHQIISSAIKNHRKVALSGWSVRQSVEIAQRLGLLNFDDNVFISDRDAAKLLAKDVVYLIAGCYGQSNSSLARASRGEHRFVTVEEDAMVVFSADPNPPGTREDVEKVMDNLILRGAEAIYSEIQDNLHVSGHGTRGDIKTLASIAKPRYFMPLGGTITKMRAYRSMVEELGFDGDNVFEQLEGDTVIFANGTGSKGESIDIKHVLAQGMNAESVQPLVVKDRGILSSEGVFVVVVPYSKQTKKPIGKVEIITRGFVYVKESKELVGNVKQVINKVIVQNQDKASDWGFIKKKIENAAMRHLSKQTGKKPMIIVHSITV